MEIVAGADYFDWKARAQSFEKMAAYSFSGYTLGSGEDAEQVGVAVHRAEGRRESADGSAQNLPGLPPGGSAEVAPSREADIG